MVLKEEASSFLKVEATPILGDKDKLVSYKSIKLECIRIAPAINQDEEDVLSQNYHWGRLKRLQILNVIFMTNRFTRLGYHTLLIASKFVHSGNLSYLTFRFFIALHAYVCE